MLHERFYGYYHALSAESCGLWKESNECVIVSLCKKEIKTTSITSWI